MTKKSAIFDLTIPQILKLIKLDATNEDATTESEIFNFLHTKVKMY